MWERRTAYRSRFGGRIKTERHQTGYFDMGPAWFCLGQPRIAALTERLGLEKFHQFADGDLSYENERGQTPIYTHPSYGLPQFMVGHWDGQLHFSGTEVAPEFGDYLEGALEAAENTFRLLTQAHY